MKQSLHTIERWKKEGDATDKRQGPNSAPHNKISARERSEVIALVNSKKYRNLSPQQIVPHLADEGKYLVSESTMYRILREEELLAHRGDTKPREARKIKEHCMTAPLQVWSWDITYLKCSKEKGRFFYLYLTVDIWSRKIVGAEVHDVECGERAANFLSTSIKKEGADPAKLTVHQDNGAPMKSVTLKSAFESLGVLASYSRPATSDDNAYSEALFRTLKYRPGYPRKGFGDLEEAQAWVSNFVQWYNDEHLHSAIAYVTPNERHNGVAEAKLKKRTRLWENAKRANPKRWGTRKVRNWQAPQVVYLNPSQSTKTALELIKPKSQMSHAA
jgi:transposase InsO family protein